MNAKFGWLGISALLYGFSVRQAADTLLPLLETSSSFGPPEWTASLGLCIGFALNLAVAVAAILHIGWIGWRHR